MGLELRDCPGHIGFRVDNNGEVLCCLKRIGNGKGNGKGSQMVTSQHWRPLKGTTSEYGYRYVRILGRREFIHRLVLEAFVGPAPEGMECRHLNGDRSDNRLSNLVWGTRKENVQDAFDHGTFSRGEMKSHSVLTEDIVRIIRQLRKTGLSSTQIAKRIDQNRSTVLGVIRGTTWKHVR